MTSIYFISWHWPSLDMEQYLSKLIFVAVVLALAVSSAMTSHVTNTAGYLTGRTQSKAASLLSYYSSPRRSKEELLQLLFPLHKRPLPLIGSLLFRRKRENDPDEEQQQTDDNEAPSEDSAETVENPPESASTETDDSAKLPESSDDASQPNVDEPQPSETDADTSDQNSPPETSAQEETEGVAVVAQLNADDQHVQYEVFPVAPEDSSRDQDTPFENTYNANEANPGGQDIPQEAVAEAITDAPISVTNTPVAAELMLELGIYVDQYQWEKVLEQHEKDEGKAESHIRTALSAMAGQAQAVYSLPSIKPKIDIKIVSLQILKQQPQELVTCNCRSRTHLYGTGMQHGNAYLDAFGEFTKKASVRWDASILISDFVMQDNVGLAKIASACTIDAVGYVLGFDGFIMAHEIFHILGMGHDMDYPISWWGDVNRKFLDTYVWSAKKIWDYRQYLRSHDVRCLRSEDFASLPDIPTSQNSGETYSPDSQCLLSDRHSQSNFNTAGNQCPRGFCISNAVPPPNPMKEYRTLYKTTCGAGKDCEASLYEWGVYASVCKEPDTYTNIERFNFAFGVCNDYDLGNDEYVDRDTCARKCLEDSQCKAFAFDAAGQAGGPGSCKLKSHNCFPQLHSSHIKANEFYVKDFE